MLVWGYRWFGLCRHPKCLYGDPGGLVYVVILKCLYGDTGGLVYVVILNACMEIRVLIGLCRHPQMLVLGIQVLLWFLRICLIARANIWIPA
jgi:hypothetical protein